VATKTPSKGKKAPEKGKASAPKKSRAGKAPPAEAKEPEPTEAEPGDEDEDEDEDGDLDEQPKAAAPAAPAKKPAAAKSGGKGAVPGEDPPQVVPARRLTPEAKAKINELVSKGMPLGDALRAAAAWETFVAPVREEPAKLVQGRSFEGGGRPPARPKSTEDSEEREDREDRDEEPSGAGGGGDDD
jgi:hypothetical protein